MSNIQTRSGNIGDLLESRLKTFRSKEQEKVNLFTTPDIIFEDNQLKDTLDNKFIYEDTFDLFAAGEKSPLKIRKRSSPQKLNLSTL
jgi:hypothetical protein